MTANGERSPAAGSRGFSLGVAQTCRVNLTDVIVAAVLVVAARVCTLTQLAGISRFLCMPCSPAIVLVRELHLLTPFVSDYGYSCRYNREVKKRGRLPGSVSLNTQVKQWTSTAKAQGQSSRNDVSVGSPAFASPEVTLDTNAQFPVLTPGAVDAATRSSTKSVDGSTGPDDSRHQHRAHPHLPPISSTALPPPPGRFPSSHDARLPRRRTASLAATAMDIGMGDSDVFASDESAGQPSPMNGNALHDLGGLRRSRPSFRSVIATDRGSFSTNMTTAPDAFAPDFLQKAPTEDCCYRFLDPVLPYIRNIVPASVACEMLDIFLTDPGSSLFRGASPYILTRIFRKQSITHPSNPRRTTPALLAAILWCVAQTADIMLLHVPGSRAKIVNDLYDLATSLIAERDPDRWRRIHGLSAIHPMIYIHTNAEQAACVRNTRCLTLMHGIQPRFRL